MLLEVAGCREGFVDSSLRAHCYPSRHCTGSTCILLLSLTALLWACGDFDISVSIPVAAGAPGCSTSEAGSVMCSSLLFTCKDW